MNYPRSAPALALACLLSLSAFSTGCGKSIVTGVTVSTAQQNGDEMAALDIQFLTNGLELPTVSLPIFNPTEPSVGYGNLGLSQVSSTTGQIQLEVDLTTVAKLPSGAATLPNGTPVPVASTGSVGLLSIPIPSTRFVLYLALQLNAVQPGQSPVAMVGVALPFTQLDSVGATVGDVDLFLPFDIDNVAGSAGVFGGKQSGQSGVALFVDVAGLIPQTASVAHTQILSLSPGIEKEYHISNTLNELGSRHTCLTVE